ncbi:MAG: FtsW/RodA/SpoVE family cell cycle protein [Chloroflexi bacterium]|nr:FtsW/RodA/SpoVE family cell cycle protein [Chloroflexota bacterium]
MGLGSPITSGPFGAAGWVGSILRRLDWLSVAAIGLLMVCGLGMAWINARSYGQELLDPSSIFLRSIIWISLSVITFTVVTAINWRWIRTFAWPLYGANLLLLIATLIFGQDSGGNSRAIAVFGIAIQSSEIAKILTLVALATVLTRESAESDTLSNTLLGGLVVAPPFILVAIQPDAGTALIIVAALFGGLLLSGAATRWIAGLAAFGVLILPLAWTFLIADYQKERLIAFIDPNADPAGPKYQLEQALVAIRSGGLFGIGFDGTGGINPLPVQESDFVFAALVRSFGLVGGLLVIGLIGLLVARLIWHAWESPDSFGTVLGGGLAAIILVQGGVNIAMNLGIAPITGIPLPFVSYGGASAISLAFGLGLVQSHRVHQGGGA